MVPPLHEVEPSKRDDGEDVEEETEMEKYEIYTMKIFGFRVNEASQSGPQMQWLRWRDTGKIM